ncbi:leucine-rich repeat protein [Enterococcus spodopteracolus]|uniref:leucine-rich repeat protein n=1 Tax=Enterococcus spodopteracolus TaxID=3034501 RepID=UPI00384C04B3
MTGSLVIPDTISGMKITSIYRNSNLGTFEQAVFTTLKLSNSLTTIGYKSFQNSIFSGEIKLASVERIGYKAFYSSEFSGTLDVSNVTVIRAGAFNSSKINKVIRGDVEMSDGSTTANNSGIHPQAIKLANGAWYDGSND